MESVVTLQSPDVLETDGLFASVTELGILGLEIGDLLEGHLELFLFLFEGFFVYVVISGSLRAFGHALFNSLLVGYGNLTFSWGTVLILSFFVLSSLFLS
jgi:hypothetical protein